MEYNLLETNLEYFDGSNSFDADGIIISYSWDFGDGSTGSGITATHTYTVPGKYRVILTVIDDDDLQNTCNKNIDINIDNEHISKSNNLLYNDEEQIEDFKNLDSNSIKFNEKLASPRKGPKEILFKINQLLQKLLNIKKDKITENLDINVNMIEDLINTKRIIENYSIIAVIDLNEIININSEKDVNEDIENISTKKFPGFIINLKN